jgi:translocation and assembly module TamA
MRPSRCLFPLLAILFFLPSGRISRAADPQPYAVTLTPTGNAALDQALHDSSTLVTLQSTGAVGPFGLVARAQQDVGRLQAVLGSFGYYQGQVMMKLDGHPADEPDLPDLLASAPAAPPLPVTVAFTTGPLFHLGKVDIDGTVPQAARDAMKLAPGDPAVAADVLAAQGRILTALRDAGYALACIPTRRRSISRFRSPAGRVSISARSPSPACRKSTPASPSASLRCTRANSSAPLPSRRRGRICPR